MSIKLSEKLIADLQFDSGIHRDTEVKGLMVICNKRSKSYACQGDVWRSRVFIRTVRFSIGRIDRVSLREARVKAKEVMAQIQSGIDPNEQPDAGKLTLAEAWKLYRRGRGKDLSPRTIDWYQSHIDRGLAKWNTRLLGTITKTECARLHDALTEQRGPYDANGAMRAFSAIYNDAMRVEDLPNNPVKLGVRFNKEKPRDWALGKEDLPGWWQKVQAIENPVKREAHIALMFTGLRSGSLKTIRWDDIDDEGVVFVRQIKGGRQFHLPLPAALIARLKALKEETKVLESPFVFPSTDSKSGHFINLRAEGMPSPHAYRHTFRTLALECGIDFTAVSLILNHSIGHVSFNYITREKLTGHLREQVERMATFLAGAFAT